MRIDMDMNNDLPALDRDARPEHLLWALLFATEYPSVLHLLARLCLGSSGYEKAKKWVWYIAERDPSPLFRFCFPIYTLSTAS
jgi:hypothetical protein